MSDEEANELSDDLKLGLARACAVLDQEFGDYLNRNQIRAIAELMGRALQPYIVLDAYVRLLDGWVKARHAVPGVTVSMEDVINVLGDVVAERREELSKDAR